jgi:Flp pilus assembly protein TadB
MGDVLMPLAIVGLILLAGPRNDRIVPFRRMNASASLHIPLILELLAVALRQGSSITRALDTVAQVVDVGLGTAVGKVIASLHRESHGPNHGPWSVTTPAMWGRRASY